MIHENEFIKTIFFNDEADRVICRVMSFFIFNKHDDKKWWWQLCHATTLRRDSINAKLMNEQTHRKRFLFS